MDWRQMGKLNVTASASHYYQYSFLAFPLCMYVSASFLISMDLSTSHLYNFIENFAPKERVIVMVAQNIFLLGKKPLNRLHLKPKANENIFILPCVMFQGQWVLTTTSTIIITIIAHRTHIFSF